MRSRLGMSAYYQKKEGGGQDLSRSHLARGDRVLIRVLTRELLQDPISLVVRGNLLYRGSHC